MSTETSAMPEHMRKQFEIRRKLDAIAPFPQGETVTARDLARHFAVCAQERFTKMLHPAVEVDGAQVAAMGAEFAAAHALLALTVADVTAPIRSGFVAAQIRDALEDGGEIGSWLFDLLGEETSNDVAKLAGELADLQAEKAAAS
jgi:hypothetical protein